MNSLKNQRGIGLINLMLILFGLVFLGTFAIKVIPIYVDNRYVVTGLKSLTNAGGNINQMSDAEIRKKLSNFFLLNAVTNVNEKSIVIAHQSDRVVVKIDYEKRVNLFSNLDVIANFTNHLDSNHPLTCCNPAVDEMK
jgi:hypothetical protein